MKEEDKNLKILPKSIKIISAVNIFAALLHLLFWGLALSTLLNQQDTVNAGLSTTIGVGVADLLISVPLLFWGGFGLYRLKFSGWLSAQMAHVLYVYSMTFVLVRDFISGQTSPGTLIFLPFTLFAIWAFSYLYKNKNLFNY